MKISVTPPPLTPAASANWLQLLRFALGGHHAPLARLLGRSSVSLYSYYTKPPTEWWWLHVYEAALLRIMAHLHYQLQHTTATHKIEAIQFILNGITHRLTSLTPSSSLYSSIYHLTAPDPHSQRFILRHLPANTWTLSAPLVTLASTASPPISERQLRRAADLLGVRQRRKGYQGPSQWRRPPTLYEEAISQDD